MNIIELKASNFKRIKAISIPLGPGVTELTGPNDSGKSSTLDAIIAAFGGARNTPADPVRHGAEIARIEVNLGTLVVRWSCKPGDKPKVIVESGDGTMSYKSPQTMLDALFGAIAFDPLAFTRMKPADQRATLAQLVGLTGQFDKLNAEIKALYDARTNTNRDIKSRKALVETIPAEDVEPVDLAALMQQYEQAHQHNDDIDRARRSIELARTEIRNYLDRATKLRERAAAMIAEADEIEKVAAQRTERLDQVDVNTPKINTDELREMITQAEVRNTRWRKQQDRNLQLETIAAVQAQADKMTADIEALEERKAALVAAAKMPLEGLALAEDGVTLNGVPFEQASSAQQWRACVKIGMALNPKVKVILVRDGSLLDSKSKQALRDDPELAGYQIIMETVDESGKIGIAFEEGVVVAIDGVPVNQSEEVA